jgi:hypothetical protein
MRVRNHFVSGMSLGRATEEGESPVCENEMTLRWYLSTAEHEKFCWNPGGPPSKAKYEIATDSELVP